MSLEQRLESMLSEMNADLENIEIEMLFGSSDEMLREQNSLRADILHMERLITHLTVIRLEERIAKQKGDF